MKKRCLVIFLLLASLAHVSLGATCAKQVLPAVVQPSPTVPAALPFSITDEKIWFQYRGKLTGIEDAIDLVERKSGKSSTIRTSDDPTAILDHSTTVEVISFVGRLASVRIIDVWSSGERPFGSAKLRVVDLDNPDKLVSLRRLFRDGDILNAFADSKDEILNSAGRRVIEDGGTARDIVAFGLSENFLSEFAFTGVDGNCAIISFVINSLGHGDGLENDNFYSIALPMSAPFKLLLLRANSLNQGFLSSNRSRVNAVRVVHHSGK